MSGKAVAHIANFRTASLVVCLQAGLSGQTLAWARHNAAAGPSPREGATAAFDQARGIVVMFGGNDTTANLSETWEWNGTTWSPRSLPLSPPARSLHSMVYDTHRSRMVVFGGTNTSDTWEYDGATWIQRTPAIQPPTRVAAGMAYHEARRVSVLFGGYWQGVHLGDTWQWDGAAWTQITVTGAPPPRSSHSMVYDAARARILMRGGNPNPGDDTWVFDGASWSTLPGPQPANNFRIEPMVYDRDRGLVLYMGPHSSAAESVTHVWSSTGWSSFSSWPSGPPSRKRYCVAYDPIRRVTWLFGGSTDNGIYGDLWSWDNSPISNQLPHHPGCPGPAGVPQLDMQRARLGTTWTVSLTGPYPATAFVFGLSDSSWGGIPLPASLTGLGMPGCTLNLEPLSWALATPTAGTASFQINAAATLGLPEFTAYSQAFCFAPGANAFGAVVSDSIELLISRI